MFIVHVFVRVHASDVEAFIKATRINAQSSIQTEPGVARFDVIQQQEDPTRLVLVEVYRDEAAAGAHKDTTHYQTWRDTVAPMMAEPRTSCKYHNVYPGDKDWG